MVGLLGSITPLAFVLPTVALAHAFLERATPPVGSEIAASPPELVITFTEPVEPAFSTIEVQDAVGMRIQTGRPHPADGDRQRLTVSLPRLAPGTYEVVWHVTSVDTHKTEGSYVFTIIARP